MQNVAAPLLLCLFFALFGASCDRMGKKGEKPGPSDRGFTVGDARVQPGETPVLIKVKGVFAPTQRLQIKSEFTGKIQEVSVVEGQAISKGDPLLKFEDEELPSVLERQGAELKDAEDQQELDTRWASREAPAELTEEAEEPVEPEVEVASRVPPEFEPTPAWVPPSGYYVPVPGLPEDAGGAWPKIEIVRDYAAMSQDPEDAGGIWPDYGRRKRVMGDQDFSVVERGYGMGRMGNVPRVNRPSGTYGTYVRPATVAPAPAPVEYVPVTEGGLTQSGPSQDQNARVTESLLALDQAKVDRIKAEIAITESQLAGRSLSSPMEGLVAKVAVTQDSQVKPDDLLALIIRVDPIELILKIPKELVDKLERGQEVTVSLADQPGQLFKGEISFIGAQLDEEKKSVEVRIRVANPEFKIKVGMEGMAEIAGN